MKHKKMFYASLLAVIFLITGSLLILNSYVDDSIRTIACYDYPDNSSGKDRLPIPCSQDSDCNTSDENVMAGMKSLCSPAEVGLYKCGFRDFCGSDGYCKHDCSLG